MTAVQRATSCSGTMPPSPGDIEVLRLRMLLLAVSQARNYMGLAHHSLCLCETHHRFVDRPFCNKELALRGRQTPV